MDASRTHVLHDESPLAQWELVLGEPAPRLRPYVLGYEGYVERTPEFSCRKQLPTGKVPLIIGFGPAMGVHGPAGAPAPHTTFVAGLHESYTFTESPGKTAGVQVNFTPIGAYRFFGLPMERLTNRVTELDDLFGPLARRLQEQLHDAPDWHTRFHLLDAVITARMAETPAPSEGVVWAWQRLAAEADCANIGALAAELGWSRKHLIARFREQIGLPPKAAARILRFGRAVRLLERSAAARWAEVAQVCGYYDQAHLIRDFHTFAGSAPGEYLGRRLAARSASIGS